ncbi:hypothetical protein [Streptomyces sp. 2314.4]|uniref:hypothetical protein n=1 Tax=Streptomyces sp. 2314.4 TaxID=1881025 RepID=UPI0008994A9A|nr:hypothetical protein [Streptomyces sp. 2314.4]SEC12788.1 hypothetical protein SAMN05428943_1085 [Streptomyces sp. 2314.4]
MTPSTPPGLGTRLVADALGIDHPADLLARHNFLSPHGQMAALIVDTAWKVDDLDHKIVQTSRSAYRELQAIERGVGSTVLGTIGADINILAERRGQSTDHLKALTGAYRRSVPQAEDPPAKKRGHSASRAQTTSAPASQARAATLRTAAAPPPSGAPISPAAAPHPTAERVVRSR